MDLRMRNDIAGALLSGQRIAVVGGPKTGKTTLARSVLDRNVIASDDYMHLGWERSAETVVHIANQNTKFLAEGVRVEGAIRRGMSIDTLIWLTSPKAPRTKAQIQMGKSTDARIKQLIETLRGSGVVIITE